jgi:hypothetical protein
MSTNVLAYKILLMGFVTFLNGAFGLLMLVFEEIAELGRSRDWLKMKNPNAPAVKREAEDWGGQQRR